MDSIGEKEKVALGGAEPPPNAVAPTPPKIPGDAAANQNLPDAIDDAEMLMCFASERGLGLSDNLVKSVVAARRQLEANCDLSAEEETKFWGTLNALTKAVSPVSTLSLRATMDSEDTNTKKFFGFAIRRGSVARRAVNAYTNVAIISLIVLLLVQVYWIFGSQISSDIQKTNKEIADAEVKVRASQRAPVALTVDPRARPASDSTSARVEEVDAKALAVLIENLRMRKDAAYNLLKLWIWPVEGWVVVPAGPDSGKQIANENIARLQLAQVMLEVIQRYLLPLLYGLLGTCVYILRTLSDEIRRRVYTEGSNIGFNIRLYLGTLGGMVIAWFVIPEATEGLFKSLSPFALAFLAGYSVELVFAAMDRLLSAFTSKTDDPQRPDANRAGAGATTQ